MLFGIRIKSNWCTNLDTPDDDESGSDDDDNKVDWVIVFWLVWFFWITMWGNENLKIIIGHFS